MKVRKIYGLVTLASLAAFGASCQPPASSDNSKLSTLDNFAGGSVTNSCGGTAEEQKAAMALFAKPEMSQAFAGTANSAVIKALSGIPLPILEDMFATVQIKVVTDSQISGHCGQGTVSCWKEDDDSRLSIYVSNKEEDISGMLVRSIGYYFSQVGINVVGDEKDIQKFSIVDEDPKFTESKAQLVKKFIGDLSQSSSFKLSSLNTHVKAKLFEDDMSANEALAALEAAPNTVRADFRDYVFAEAFDSFYCSAKSRSNMKAFAESSAYYIESVEPLIEAMYNGSGASLVSDQSSEMSLWGRNARQGRAFGSGGFWAGAANRRTMRSNWAANRSANMAQRSQMHASAGRPLLAARANFLSQRSGRYSQWAAGNAQRAQSFSNTRAAGNRIVGGRQWFR